jgi:organic radical activating enzyme
MKIKSIHPHEKDSLFNLPDTCRILLFDSLSDDDEEAHEMFVDRLLNNSLIEKSLSVLIEGGEPLYYLELTVLINALLGMGKKVYLKTFGYLPMKGIPKETIKIVILPLPKSIHEDCFLFENAEVITRDDFIAVYILSEEDIETAITELLKAAEFNDDIRVVFYVEKSLYDKDNIQKTVREKLSHTHFDISFLSK